MRAIVTRRAMALASVAAIAITPTAAVASARPRMVTYAYATFNGGVLTDRFIASIRIDSGTRATLFKGTNPSWSRDGHTLAYVGPNDDIFVQRDGGARVDTGVFNGVFSRISVSADGSRIAFSTNEIISVMNATAPYDPQPTALVGFDPAWSPDGTKIAFENEFGDIEAAAPDGSDAVGLSSSERDTDPTWAPDGQHVAYVDQARGEHGVRLVGADGSDNHVIYASEVGSNLSFSPDGTQIVLNAAPHPWGLNQLVVITLAGVKIRDYPRINVVAVAWQP